MPVPLNISAMSLDNSRSEDWASSYKYYCYSLNIIAIHVITIINTIIIMIFIIIITIFIIILVFTFLIMLMSSALTDLRPSVPKLAAYGISTTILLHRFCSAA